MDRLTARLNDAFAKAMEIPEEYLPAGLSPDANRLPFKGRRRSWTR